MDRPARVETGRGRANNAGRRRNFGPSHRGFLLEYVNLGRTGIKVSRLCLGCMTYGSKAWRAWVLEEEESLPFFRKAWESGINFFDTADMYSRRRQRGDHSAGR